MSEHTVKVEGQMPDAIFERELTEIVRCRDCKHMIHFWHHDDERWQCTNEMLEGLDVSPRFFCAWGERKEVKR